MCKYSYACVCLYACEGVYVSVCVHTCVSRFVFLQLALHVYFPVYLLFVSYCCRSVLGFVLFCLSLLAFAWPSDKNVNLWSFNQFGEFAVHNSSAAPLPRPAPLCCLRPKGNTHAHTEHRSKWVFSLSSSVLGALCVECETFKTYSAIFCVSSFVLFAFFIRFRCGCCWASCSPV